MRRGRCALDVARVLFVAGASLVCIGQTAGCLASEDEPAVAAASAAVIYGDDDRIEVRDLRDQSLRELLLNSVAAVMTDSALSIEHDEARIVAPSLAEQDGLCAQARFAQQPAAAQCSALLVDADTLLTAGHCMRHIPCESARFVFGYIQGAGDAPEPLQAEDVYRCQEVLLRELSTPDAAVRIDYAWVRLDRPAEERAAPIEIRGEDVPLEVGESLTVAGFGGGVPMKVSTGAVADTRLATLDHFVSTSDTVHGDSGGPVFDGDDRLVGIFVRGATDYVAADGGCNANAQLADTPDVAEEQSTYAFRALEGLCAAMPEAAICCQEGARCRAQTTPQAASACAASEARAGSAAALAQFACAAAWLSLRTRRRRGRIAG